MQFHFVDCRLDARVAQQQLELWDGHVRGTDMPHKSEIDKLFHLAPGFHEAFVDVGLRVRAARSYIAARRMKIWKWPMDKVKVEIIEAQIGKRLAARRNHVVLAVLVVPKLGCHPQLLALDAASQNDLKRSSDLGLIAINRSAIEVPIASRGGAENSLGNLRRRHVVGTERA